MSIKMRGYSRDDRSNAGITLAFAKGENTGPGGRAAPQLFIVLLLNAFGVMLTLSSAFRLPCHMGAVVGFTVLQALVLGAGFLLAPRWKPAVAGVAGLFCLLCFGGRALLAEGFAQTASWVTEVIAECGARSAPWAVKAVSAYETAPMTLFFAALLFPVLLLLSYAVLHRFNIFLLLLVIVPVLEAALFFGCLPSVTAFVLLLLGGVSLLVLNQSAGRPGRRCLDARGDAALRRQVGNLSLGVAALAGVLIAAAWLLVSDPDYAAFTNHLGLRSQAGEALKKTLAFTYEEKTPPQGGITGGQFAATGRFSFKGETALVVEADSLRGSIYLKGYVGGDYTGGGWKPLPGELARRGEELSAALRAQELPSELLGYDNAMLARVFHAEPRLLQVTKTGSAVARYHYVPYCLSAAAAGALRVNEQGVMTGEPGKADSYAATYYDVLNYDNNLFLLDRPEIKKQLLSHLALAGGAVSAEQLEGYFGREEQYADFVHAAYTRLPDDLSGRLAEEFAPLEHFLNIESLIKTVLGNLSGRAAYTLTPGDTPGGKDYVDYFLYENRKGYCTHFASAATVIFRLCGVPARYVEGYVATIEDYARAARTDEGRYVLDIKDTNAHAWCEIYLDGFGWLPVEVTPGLVAINTGDTAPADGESIAYETDEENELNDIPMETPQLENAPSADASAGGSGAGPANGVLAPLASLRLMLTAVALLLLILCVLPLLLSSRAVKRRIKALGDENRSRSGLAWYAYLKDALKVAAPQHLQDRGISLLAWAKEVEGKAVFPPGTLSGAMPVLQKAAYAQNEISAAEHESLTQLLERAIKHLYRGLPMRRKLKWRYIGGLPVQAEIPGKGEKR